MAFSAKRFFAAGAAHVDRSGARTGSLHPLGSNPGALAPPVGGAIFLAARALRLCGAKVALMSGRGGDADAEAIAGALEAAGIDDLAMTWLDRQSPNAPAPVDDGVPVSGGTNAELYELLSGRVFSRRHIREAMAGCDGLIFDTNLPPSGISYLIDRFRGRPIAAIGVSAVKAVRLAPHLADMSMLFLQHAEAAGLVGATPTTETARLAQLLAEAGALRAVITDGIEAAAILDDGRVTLQGTFPTSAFSDTEGAQAALAGVTLLAHADGHPFAAAVRLGMAAACLDLAAAPDDVIADIERLATALPTPIPAG